MKKIIAFFVTCLTVIIILIPSAKASSIYEKYVEDETNDVVKVVITQSDMIFLKVDGHPDIDIKRVRTYENGTNIEFEMEVVGKIIKNEYHRYTFSVSDKIHNNFLIGSIYDTEYKNGHTLMYKGSQVVGNYSNSTYVSNDKINIKIPTRLFLNFSNFYVAGKTYEFNNSTKENFLDSSEKGFEELASQGLSNRQLLAILVPIMIAAPIVYFVIYKWQMRKTKFE
ncbi:MAG: hypothetical protein COS08_02915 [Euryarchaeota archaeon CG01_land_8_20_14_3_00_38_12]|nr:MAG: hypothetical protein COS08_02915 [Euryarchaeota archaeon CG01_land_8_20_14_3_00_38_12]PJB22044.1 MAG: hypothetical protein CO114_02145 [Euryarchaeota archaeon CG_4_9_14_3_um_filter_38_12]